MFQTGGFGVLQAGHIYETRWWAFFFTFWSTSLGWGLPKNGPFLTKKGQAWQAYSWLNQSKWEGIDGPYHIYVYGNSCVRVLFFLPKKAKHGRLAPDSTKASGNALMGHNTSTCMGIHALGSFSSLATPKMAENGPFFDQKKPSMAGLLLTQPYQIETP